MNISSSIIIGIVLYNPDLQRLSENINSCLQQVDHLVLVDNGSDNINKIKEIYASNDKISFICNKNNNGIAYALNQITDYASKNNFEYFLTLDQDSVMKNNYLKEMIKNIPTSINWGIACPEIIDINLAEEKFLGSKEISEIKNAKDVITSGCIVKTKIAKNIGGFNNDLFIDYVDVDFNQRMLLDGYKIIKIGSAILFHEIGKSEYRRFLGTKILVDNHNAMRRYYITRNRLFFSRKYFGKKGYYKERFTVFLSEWKIIFFEEDKILKIKSVRKGIKDFKNMYKELV